MKRIGAWTAAALILSVSVIWSLMPSSAPASAPVKAPAARGNAVEAADGRPTVGWIKIKDSLHDGPPPIAIMASSDRANLPAVLQQLNYVARDKRSKGVVIFLDQAEVTLSQVYEIAAGIEKVRAAGKKVLVFSESYDMPQYQLACSADMILLQKKGMLQLNGVSVEEMYLGGTFEKFGLKADFIQVGKYKGAQDPLTRTGPSPEWSETIDRLLDDLYAIMLERISASRKLTKDQVEKALADCWSMRDQDYVKRHLVDRLVDRDMTDVSVEVFDKGFDWDQEMGGASAHAEVDSPLAVMKLLLGGEERPPLQRATIAVINAHGAINSGDSNVSGAAPRAGLFGGPSIGSRSLSKLLADAKTNDLIKGVVIRINSPGGSALASEVIWQAVKDVASKKPVYISVGGMAASGGYYIASACDYIYVEPSSIVGSIGVVGGKIVMKDLYGKVGLSVNRRSRGPMGDMFNSVEPFTPEQRKVLEQAFQNTYDQFLDRVKTGRGKRVKNLDDVAQGRVFTGRMAVQNGLADKVAGLDVTVTDIAAQLKLEPGSYDVVEYPGPVSVAEYFGQVMGLSYPGGEASFFPAGAEGMAAVQVAKKLIGPRAWPNVQATLNGLSQMNNEHVLMLMPNPIVIK